MQLQKVSLTQSASLGCVSLTQVQSCDLDPKIYSTETRTRIKGDQLCVCVCVCDICQSLSDTSLAAYQLLTGIRTHAKI